MIRARQASGDRGGTLVEAAMVTPVFLFVLFGVMEYGLAYRDNLTVANSTRDAARVATTGGNSADADYGILQQISDDMDVMGHDTIDLIVVFNAGGPSGSVKGESTTDLAACKSGTSVTGVCNVYTSSDLERPLSDFGCLTTGSLDSLWCPMNRSVAFSDPPDYIGVYLETTHDYATGMFGDSVTISDETVMRIEPQLR
ncbi:MAG: pilus assembly protein [Actinomycetia bacterium]|nr:pilus assembly protein [Actinomycetes bacterium]